MAWRMRVEDAMTSAVVSVPAATSLRAAAGHMLSEGVSGVVVTRDGDPAGVLTEHDFLAAGHEHDRPFSEIPVYAAASGSLVTIEPSASLQRAADEMRSKRIKRLPVTDGLDVVGIVTVTDLLAVYDRLDEDTRAALRKRDEWTGDAPDSVD